MSRHSDTRTEAERGAAVVEYAFLVLLVAIVALVAVASAGDTLSDTFDTIAQSVANASA